MERFWWSTVRVGKSTSSTDSQLTCSSLVAIHGINGDAVTTWTEKATGVMWLRDFLPAQFPRIRIMTFGYDADFASFASHQNLRTIAAKLLAQLAEKREEIYACICLSYAVHKLTPFARTNLDPLCSFVILSVGSLLKRCGAYVMVFE